MILWINFLKVWSNGQFEQKPPENSSTMVKCSGKTMWMREKLSTFKKCGKAYKIQLSTKLSTLSTKINVENFDLHNVKQNKCFVDK